MRGPEPNAFHEEEAAGDSGFPGPIPLPGPDHRVNLGGWPAAAGEKAADGQQSLLESWPPGIPPPGPDHRVNRGGWTPVSDEGREDRPQESLLDGWPSGIPAPGPDHRVTRGGWPPLSDKSRKDGSRQGKRLRGQCNDGEK